MLYPGISAFYDSVVPNHIPNCKSIMESRKKEALEKWQEKGFICGGGGGFYLVIVRDCVLALVEK